MHRVNYVIQQVAYCFDIVMPLQLSSLVANSDIKEPLHVILIGHVGGMKFTFFRKYCTFLTLASMLCTGAVVCRIHQLW